MRFRYIVYLLCLLPNISHGQKEAYNWHFGYGAGLDFNQTPVTATTNGAHIAVNTTASISDKNGVLQFYTDGNRVWNRNNQLMPNGTGLRCYVSNSAQSAIIIPRPLNPGRFYIFTIDEMVPDANNPNIRDGIFMSEVDMSLGLGDVISKNKVFFQHQTTRVITAAIAANKKDYWLMVHAMTSFDYIIFKVDENGARVANVTGWTDIQNLFSSGQMKFSPDGKKLAMANTRGGTVELFDFLEVSSSGGNPGFTNFHRLTGFLSQFNGPYGVEFSPDGTKLYVTDGTGVFACCDGSGYPRKESYVYQFDISLPTDGAINASKVILSREISSSALQLAPDGKIYVAGHKDVFGVEPGEYLGVIEKPNIAGAGCNFNYHGLSTNGKLPRTGLPNFVTTFFNVCNVTVNLGKDTILCEGNSLLLDLSGTGGNFVWNDGRTAPQYVVSRAGTYSVKRTEGECISADTITVQYLPKPKQPFAQDTIYLDPGSSFDLTIQQKDVSYIWHDGQTSSTYKVTQPGIYKVEINNLCGELEDSVVVLARVIPDPNIRLSIPNAFTPNGDGRNEYFRIPGIEAQSWSLSIFNRWGGLVYANKKYNNTWNASGTSTGTYIYLLKNNDTGQTFKGVLNIIR